MEIALFLLKTHNYDEYYLFNAELLVLNSLNIINLSRLLLFSILKTRRYILRHLFFINYTTN